MRWLLSVFDLHENHIQIVAFRIQKYLKLFVCSKESPNVHLDFLYSLLYFYFFKYVNISLFKQSMLILNILFGNLIVDFGGAGTKFILWKIEVVAQQYICLLMNMFF